MLSGRSSIVVPRCSSDLSNFSEGMLCLAGAPLLCCVNVLQHNDKYNFLVTHYRSLAVRPPPIGGAVFIPYVNNKNNNTRKIFVLRSSYVFGRLAAQHCFSFVFSFHNLIKSRSLYLPPSLSLFLSLSASPCHAHPPLLITKFIILVEIMTLYVTVSGAYTTRST